jgi:hypothetical protein
MWKQTLGYSIDYNWYYILKGNYMDLQSLTLQKNCGFQMIKALRTFCVCECDPV